MVRTDEWTNGVVFAETRRVRNALIVCMCTVLVLGLSVVVAPLLVANAQRRVRHRAIP